MKARNWLRSSFFVRRPYNPTLPTLFAILPALHRRPASRGDTRRHFRRHLSPVGEVA